MCSGSSGCEFTQAGKRASEEGTKAAREIAKGSIKNWKKQHDRGIVCPDEFKMKEKQGKHVLM
ncbi:MAG: hypothetical protein A3K50_01690 [Planctomycetes bacterium RIFOXYD12_FULL_42_12]|nr:MAG: hypothetical protein A3K50_01690 [Planctomycetes bacterium RIFOXYD12_FULL_42_12]